MTIQERIEQILVDHTLVPGDNEVQGECTSAACLWRGWFLGDWRRHVAEVLTTELGLQLSTGGHYVAYNVALTDEERDRAGFTHHRRSEA